MSMQMYILMVNFGRLGLEANVQPELTRRAIIEQARDIIAEGRNSIEFIKLVEGNECSDVTDEIIEAAWLSMDVEKYNDKHAAKFDHNQDDRKEAVR